MLDLLKTLPIPTTFMIIYVHVQMYRKEKRKSLRRLPFYIAF